MTVLVTGGHGFLGTSLVRALTQYGFSVLAPTRADLDLLNIVSCERLISDDFDVVVHAAADVGGLGFVQRDQLGLASRNLQMTLNLLNMLRRRERQIKLFAGIGSACSYPVCEQAINENVFWDGPCDASVESYGMQKRTLESLARQGPWRALHLPVANLYGPGDRFDLDRAHVLTALVKRVVDAKRKGDAAIDCWHPDTEREFILAADAARLIARVVQQSYNAPTHPRILNIGSGVCYRIDTILDMIQVAAGTRLTVHWHSDTPRGVARKVLDVEWLKAYLGERVLPLTRLTDGIQQTVDWYGANPTP